MKIKVDAKKFKEVAKEYGYNMKSLSAKIGYSDSYISNCVLTGEMEERVINLIDVIAGIPKNKFLDIHPFVSREELTEEELRLYTIINKACYDAFCGALKKWGGIL